MVTAATKVRQVEMADLTTRLIRANGYHAGHAAVTASFGDPRLPPHFWNKVVPEPNSGCWLWIGTTDRGGYGRVGYRHAGVRKAHGTHRLAYQNLVGEVPSGLELDHLCRVRCCVNPAHLEPVTKQENQYRGVGFVALNARKTCCPNGHEYAIESTGRRICKTCRKSRRPAEEARADRRYAAGHHNRSARRHLGDRALSVHRYALSDLVRPVVPGPHGFRYLGMDRSAYHTPMWDRARDTIAKLEVEIAAKRRAA